MTEALLATETSETKPDATTTPGGVATEDTQPTPTQQPQPGDEKSGESTETPTPEPETKPIEGEAKTEDATDEAPVLYEFKVPDGMPEDFEMDKAVFDALAEVSRETKLSQEKAQTLINKVWPVMHRRAEEQQTAVHDQWIAEVKADPEIGGQKLPENLAIAKRAMKAYASEGMQALLNGPIGSHPDVVRFLVKVGQTVSEDSFVGGKEAGKSVDPSDEAAVAKKLYPSQAAS